MRFVMFNVIAVSKLHPSLLTQMSSYLHGSSFGKGELKVLPVPVLIYHMGKNYMPVAARPSQLGTICRPGQIEDTVCVRLLQGIGPLEKGTRGERKQ